MTGRTRFSSSRSSDENSSLLDEGGSASQVPQATVELEGHGSVIWPDSLSEWFVEEGRTAVDVLLSDCQYLKGTALYGRCGLEKTGLDVKNASRGEQGTNPGLQHSRWTPYRLAINS